MKQNSQNAADLLRTYFRETSANIILQDWESVQNLAFDGPTVDEFLTLEAPTESYSFDEGLFNWKNNLCINLNEVPFFEVNTALPNAVTVETSESQYAMAA